MVHFVAESWPLLLLWGATVLRVMLPDLERKG
jgi:hypothetical protein